MVLDTELYDYYGQDHGDAGLKVALVHHLDMPIITQTGFNLSPGLNTQVVVTPSLIFTSGGAMARYHR